MADKRTESDSERWYGIESAYAAGAVVVGFAASVALFAPGLMLFVGLLALGGGLLMIPLDGRQRRIAAGLLTGLATIPLLGLNWYISELLRDLVT